MRGVMLLVLTVAAALRLHAQTDGTTFGGTVGLNAAAIRLSSDSAPSATTSIQTTPAFGLYYRSAMTRRIPFELRVGYECTGANKEYFYQRSQLEWVRILDRHNTVFIGAMVYTKGIIGGKLRAGLGPKVHYAFRSVVRSENSLPPGASGVIITPQVNKLYPAVTAELMFSLANTDIALNASAAVTPLINDARVKGFPIGAALTVKKRLVIGTRKREF
jgi:hypothetical protein